MDSFFRLLFHLWFESCLERIDEICLADEENEVFIRDNRGLAWSVLAYALLAFLPLALGIVACAVVHVAGGEYLFGLPASGLLLTASLLLIATSSSGCCCSPCCARCTCPGSRGVPCSRWRTSCT